MPDKYRYEEFTWPEIRDAVSEQRVAVLPVGTVEQHGPHLPLVTDVLTSTEMSRRAVERVPGEAVLMPSVYYSFNEHHMDFPSTTEEWRTAASWKLRCCCTCAPTWCRWTRPKRTSISSAPNSSTGTWKTP